MSVEAESGALYLSSLPAPKRAVFFALLANRLTVAGRVIFYSGASPQEVADALYALNELQHRVSGYLVHALGSDEDSNWLRAVLEFIFEQGNARVRQEAVNAWNETFEWLQAAS